MEYGLPLVLDMETGLADYFGVDGGEANYPTILPLEYKFFEAASIPNLLQGMLYICPLFYKNSLFVRYIATGAYRGILPKVLDMLQKETNLPPSKIFPWQLYTPKDLSLHVEKLPDTGKAHEKIYRRKVGDSDPTKCNKNSILALINGLKNWILATLLSLFTRRKPTPISPYTGIKSYISFIENWEGTNPKWGAGTPNFFLFKKY